MSDFLFSWIKLHVIVAVCNIARRRHPSLRNTRHPRPESANTRPPLLQNPPIHDRPVRTLRFRTAFRLPWPPSTVIFLQLYILKAHDEFYQQIGLMMSMRNSVGGSNPGSRSNSVRSSPEWKNTSRRSSTLGLIGGREDDQVGLDALMKRMKSLSERREQFTAEEQIKR